MKELLERDYEIIAYCDKNASHYENCIYPVQIAEFLYEKIFITSSFYYEEIKRELIDMYGVEERRIISKEDILGDFRNSEIRNDWVKGKLLSMPKGKILLDAGAGESKYKKYCSHLKYIAQDFGEYVPGEIDTGIQSSKWDYSDINIKCDITDIPLESGSIDAILCTEVFEHLENPILAIKEFSRLMVGGGQLLLTAPFCCLTHMAPYFYYNGFSEFWYKKHLEEYGFEIVEQRNYGNFFKYIQQELFRLNEVCERYAGEEMKKKEMETVYEMIKILSKYSENDTGSDELLRFGTMIEARKIMK